jgi:hypothetical protein
LTKKLVLGSSIVIVLERLLLKLSVKVESVPTTNVLLAWMSMGLAMGPAGMNVWAHTGSGDTIISQTAYRIPRWLSGLHLSH